MLLKVSREGWLAISMEPTSNGTVVALHRTGSEAVTILLTSASTCYFNWVTVA